MTDPLHLAELAGIRVVDARVTIPQEGLWHADVTLEKEAPALASSGLILSLADLRLTCAPYRKPIPWQGRTRVRLIGGVGGWRMTLEPKGYKLSAGVKLSLVLGDAAKACGERVVVGVDRVLGNHFARDRAPAMRLLNRWVPGAWWIDPDGTTKTGTRPTSAIGEPFDLVGFDSARGVAMIATEKPAAFVPGRTFKAPGVGTLTINCITHTLSKDALRSEVLYS